MEERERPNKIDYAPVSASGSDVVPPDETPLELHDADDLVGLLNPLKPVAVAASGNSEAQEPHDIEQGRRCQGSPFVPKTAPRMRLGYLISAIVPLSLLVIFLMAIFGAPPETRLHGAQESRAKVFILTCSDALTAVSYFFIPGAIWTVVLKRGVLLPHDIDRSMWTLWMFGAFIICCGLTHLISALCVWWPLEWVQVGMKTFTAFISYSTAIAVYKLIPLALAIPSPIALEQEVIKRKKAQRKLRDQYTRFRVLSRVTEQVRKNLNLQDICNATASQCLHAFKADICTVYRYEPSQDSAPPTANDKGKGKQDVVLDNRGQHHSQPNDYRLMSRYYRKSDRHILNKKEGEAVEMPPLHVISSLLSDNDARAIDLSRMTIATASSFATSSTKSVSSSCAWEHAHPNNPSSAVQLSGSLVHFYHDKGVQSLLCVSVPYHPNSCIILILERNECAEPWGRDDIVLLQELSAQIAIGLEHAHLLREANKGRKLAIRNLCLERAKEKAEQSSQAKSDFLATVSHEIRTPMNAICGMAKVLKGSHMSREQRECVQIISSSAKALLSLLNNILDFSKIEAGKTEIYQCPFDLCKCIQNLMGLMANYTTGKQHKVTLSTLIDPSVPTIVIGDKQHLRQVLINLLSNALKFTPEGTITLRVNTKASWDTTDSEKWTELQFDVIDTGIGIPREKQHRLFHPFSQVDSSATRKYEGTGLGLVISKRLCELMGGQMTMQSEEGKGSQFTFTIKVKVQGEVPDYAVCEHLRQIDRVNIVRLQAEQLLPEILPRPTPSTAESDSTDPASAPPSKPSGSYPLDSSDAHSVFVYSNLPQDARKHLHPHHTHSLPTRLRPLTMLSHSADSPRLPDTQHYVPQESTTVRRHSVAPQPTHEGEHEHHLPLGSILLAEDNKINQKVACKLLNRLNYTNIKVVENGRRAVEAVREASAEGHPFLIIIMDLHMPEMDGITASKIIKKDQQRWHPPPYIVACTADLQMGTRQACFRAGIDDFLEKPIKLKELSRVLLRAHRTIAQARGHQRGK